MQPHDINTAITELTGLYDNLNKRWVNDPCCTDLYQAYRQEEYHNIYEKLSATNIETVILGIIANSLNEKILTRLRLLLDKNVQIYETRQNDFKSIDFHEVYSLQEKQLFEDKFALLTQDRKDIQEYPYPTEQERRMLLKENQTEKNLLENERSEHIRANRWMLNDYYTLIHEATESFLSIINSYFPIERKKKVEPIPTPVDELAERETPSEQEEKPCIEPDTIFKSRMYERLLSLEQKLIADKYLNEKLHWVAVHENGRPDIRRLVTFLTGLLDNNYFLPYRDPKIKSFFEARYDISIGQNFEQKDGSRY